MSLASVLGAVRYFDGNPPFPPFSSFPPAYATSLSTPSPAERAKIEAAITALYNGSPNEAAAQLEAAAARGDLNFVTSTAGSVAFKLPGGRDLVGLDYAEIADLHYFNDKGKIVLEKFEITLIHEIIHTGGLLDPLPPGTDLAEAHINSGLEFNGPTVEKQNAISREIGYSDNIQANYYSSMSSNSPIWNRFDRSNSYSHGDTIKYALWDQVNFDAANNYDLSGRTATNDILFGFGGNDTLNGGDGTDYLYGGENDDKFVGAEGSDLFHGGGTRTSGGGAIAINDDGIDQADYGGSTSGKSIKITTDVSKDAVHATAMDKDHRLLVLKQATSSGTTSQSGADTLISVEKIVGTGSVDTFELTKFDSNQLAGRDQKGGLAEIDFGGQDKPEIEGDLIDARQLSENKLKIDLSGTVEIEGNADKKIKISNAERAWGSNQADKIFGTARDNELRGEGGDDTIEGRGGNDKLVGGAGKDTIKGGSGNDIIVGGNLDAQNIFSDDAAVDTITSGGGADRIYFSDQDRLVDRAGAGAQLYTAEGTPRALSRAAGEVGGDVKLLIGGERTPPPADPCNPSPPSGEEEDDTAYIAADGTKYVLSSGTLHIEYDGGTVYLETFRNGDGGIRLRETRPDQEQAECQRDPLILDLDGDREVVTELFDSTAYFDLDNDGMRERVAWMDAGDGLLAMDHDGNGTIDNGSELFGTGAVDNDGTVRGADGFAELARLDSNGDFQITSADADFAALRVWRDANMDGISDGGELVSLAELGIVSISVRARNETSLDCGCDGTIVDRAATVLTANGDRLSIFDAYLSIDQYDTIAADPGEVSAAAAALPFLIGSGSLVDLDVAMSRDPALLEMVNALSQLDAANAGEFLARVEAILLRWTEADDVAPDSRGDSINARWLSAIEKISGSAFDQARVGANPRGDAALILIGEWHEIVSSAAARLLGQTELGETLLPGLSFEAGAFYVAADGTTLAGILAGAAANAPAAMADALPYWHLILGSIEAFAGALEVTVGQIDAAAQDLLLQAGIALTPAQLRNAQFADYASKDLIGTSPLNQVGSGADLLVVGAGVESVAAGGANDIIILTRGSGAVTLDAGGGQDLLWLIDRNRSDVTLRAELADGAILISLADAGGSEIATFTAELLPSGLATSLEQIRFADGQLTTLELLSATSLPFGDNGLMVFSPESGGVLQGSSFSDLMVGADGTDRYEVGTGRGSDVVQESGRGDAIDVLSIGAALSAVTFAFGGREGRDLIVLLASGETITITGHLAQAQNRIERFEFSDGTVLDAEEVDALLATGTAGDDRISGSYRNDLLDGRGGDDVLMGRAGDDTYLFGIGSGQDRILDASGASRVQFGAGIMPDQLDVRFVEGDLIVAIAGSDDKLTIPESTFIGEWIFADGTIFSHAQIGSLIPVGDRVLLRASAGDTGVYGSSLAEALDGGAGDDELYGDRGADRYIVTGGTDKIYDTGLDIDEIYISAAFDAGKFRFDNDYNNMVITFRDSDVRTVFNQYQADTYPPTNLNGFIELVTFADGRQLDLSAGPRRSGTAGDDILFEFGYYGGVYTPGAGNDLILSSGGSHVFQFDAGFGQDLISDRGGEDRVEFGASLAGQSISWARDGNDLKIVFAGGDQLTIEDHFRPIAHDGKPVETFVLPDGTVLDRAAVNALVSVATAGDDLLFLSPTLDGGAGDDVLIGDHGANEYVFARGYGHDRIVEQNDAWYGGEPDTLRLDGLVRGDVSFGSVDGRSLTITIRTTGETITIDGDPFSGITEGFGGRGIIETIVFADGTTMTQEEAEETAYSAVVTDGDDQVSTFGYGPVLDARGGDDTIDVSASGATIAFGSASGHDVVRGSGHFDLVLTDLNAADVSFRLLPEFEGEPGNHIVLVAKNGATLTIPFGGGYDSGYEGGGMSPRLAGITFADGSSHDYRGEIGELTPRATGSSGADVLTGSGQLSNGANDRFDGGAGDDYIVGGGGFDTIVFGRGSGMDEVAFDRLGGGEIDTRYTVEMLPGVQVEDIELSWSADGSGTVEIRILDTGERLAIPLQNLTSIRFDDGRVLAVGEPAQGVEEHVWAGNDPAAPIEIGEGDDLVQTYTGNVLMPLARGSGSDRFIDTAFNAMVDGGTPDSGWEPSTLVIGAASLGALLFAPDATVPGDLVVILRATGDRVTITGQLRNGADEVGPAIASFTLSDGTTYGWDQIAPLVQPVDWSTVPDPRAAVTYLPLANLSGTASDEVELLHMLPGDSLDSLGGADRIIDVSGGATLLWGAGDGNDELRQISHAAADWQSDPAVHEELRYSGPGTVRLEGIADPGEVRFSIDQRDLLVTILATGETLRIVDQLPVLQASGPFGTTEPPVGWFEFDNGTLDWADVPALIGGIGETITSGSDGGTLDGGGGDDRLDGGSGDDVYAFGTGYAEDRIRDAGGIDSLHLGEGITRDDLHFSRTGHEGRDLLVEVSGTDRLAVTIEGQFIAGGLSSIEFFDLADGTTLGWQNVQNAILRAGSTSGADSLDGFATADRIATLGGNDRVSGQGGDDSIDGGLGRDVAVYAGARTDYLITTTNGVTTVRDTVVGRDGTDTLTNIEDLRFLGDATGTADLALDAPNRAPIVAGLALAGTEDMPLSIALADLLALGSDADGDGISFGGIVSATGGTAWLGLGNIVQFRPDANANGTLSFSYSLVDPNGGSGIGQVVIQVAAVNDAPVITPGAAQGAAGSAIVGTVSAGDVDGDVLSFALAVAPAHGTVAIDSATGAYSYMAAGGFTGEDSFVVRVTDTAGVSADAAMVVTVVPSDNLPPVLTPAAGAATEDGGILAGTLVASDPDGNGALSFALVAPVAGLQVGADGSWTFDASHAAYQGLAAGQTQVVQAQWSATDAGGASARSTIEIVVTGANDAPTLLAPIVDQQWAGGTPGAFTIPAGSFGDPDGDLLTWTVQLEDGSALPSWLTFDPATRTLTGTPPGAGAALSLKIIASDGVLTRDDIFALTATPASGGEIPWPETTNVVAFDPEGMTGTAANDFIFATSASNGNALSGLGGDDRVISESWNSSMSGGDGADVIEARNSDQTVTGGAGIDHFVFDVGNFVGESWGLDPQYLWATITDFEDGVDRIAILNTVADLSDVTFTQDGADTWISFAGGPRIVVANTSVAALSGDDLIVRLGGDAGVPPAAGGVAYPVTTNVVAYDAAVMGGTVANDLVHALSAENGGWNGTALLGRDGDDLLITESWASFASGGAGNDVIEVRNDNVVAIGGAGYDYFVFRTDDFVGEGWAMDPEFVWATITGFTSGEDKIVIAGAGYGDLDIDQVGDNVEIAWAGAPRIILSGSSVADFDASDFIFETAPLQARVHAGWNPFTHDIDGHARNRAYNPEYTDAVQPEMLTWFA